MNSLFGFYHGYFEHTGEVFEVLREGMKEINPDSSFSFFTLGLDAMKKYSGFREKIRNVNSEVREIWIYDVNKHEKTDKFSRK